MFIDLPAAVLYAALSYKVPSVEPWLRGVVFHEPPPGLREKKTRYTSSEPAPVVGLGLTMILRPSEGQKILYNALNEPRTLDNLAD